MSKELLKSRSMEPLPVTGTHVSTHICWPWDLDLWMELNNGRSLTLYDLGRLPLGVRTGLSKTLLAQRWGMTMAGVSVRWRRRVRVFDRVTIRSRGVGWDHRFLYLEQSMWKSNGDCASQALYRAAITDKNGIVTTDRLMSAMGVDGASPALPDWATAWIEAEAQRPWPPEITG